MAIVTGKIRQISVTLPSGFSRIARAIAVSSAGLLLSSASASPPQGDLRVGAAKADITLPQSELPMPFERIADRVWVRVLIVESGGSRVALVIGDAPMIATPVALALRQKIAARLEMPLAQVMLGLSHTHNNPRIDLDPVGILLPGSPELVELFQRQTMSAVEGALRNLQPARMAVGRGEVALVGPKNSWSDRHQRVIEIVNRANRADASTRLGVLRFETLAGRPLAFVLNYGLNPVLAMEMKGAISGDVPGAAARMIEDRTGGNAVALFTIGAAGNPLYRARDDGRYRSADPQTLISAMATVIAEEALAVSEESAPRYAALRLAGQEQPLICPGKVTSPLNLPDRCAHEEGSDLPKCDFEDEDRPPVTLAMGALQIGPVSLVHADANISGPVGHRLSLASPLRDTWTVSRNYGPMKYIVADADYPLHTYEATATTARAGCAEAGFLSNAEWMIDRNAGLGATVPQGVP